VFRPARNSSGSNSESFLVGIIVRTLAEMLETSVAYLVDEGYRSISVYGVL
jgi:hypothetical protein